MNYPRVNLLKKGEQRYQGAVSGRFILISAIVIPVMAVALVSFLVIMKHKQVQSELTQSRERWQELDPQYEAFKGEGVGFKKGKKMGDLFAGWSKSRISFYELLSEVQNTVPSNMQFSRLSLRSASAAASYKTPEDIAIWFNLIVEGRAFGESAEQHVFGFQKDLLDQKHVSELFEYLEPAYIRKRVTSDGDALREFKLEGGSAKGRAR